MINYTTTATTTTIISSHAAEPLTTTAPPQDQSAAPTSCHPRPHTLAVASPSSLSLSSLSHSTSLSRQSSCHPRVILVLAGADLRAALVASCLRGALPPVDLRAVCLVWAMVDDAVNDERWCDGAPMRLNPARIAPKKEGPFGPCVETRDRRGTIWS